MRQLLTRIRCLHWSESWAGRAGARSARAALGLPPGRVLDLLGADTRDVYLNGRAYWRNVPAGVWEYYIGGYQVLKKWLSYREAPLLGRPLRIDEARHVTDTARRIAALLLLGPELDANYTRIASRSAPWSAGP